ncbi:MAG: hypothetical protein LBQ70_00615 [Prevotellaceae bacterium]|jgi:hypothetical protein|nr:hypothetical protein [Prevotellaceae bacterium]
MNRNKTVSDNKLRELFKKIPPENLSSGFKESMMAAIEKEAARQRRKKSRIVVLQILSGISGMLLLPLLTVRLCNLFVPEFAFSFSDVNIDFGSNSIVIGLAVLLLLTADVLYGKHLARNRNKCDNVQM